MNAQGTSSISATGGFDEASFDAFLRGRDEPGWLRERRREAFAAFLASPWPTARDEEWRRTDIRALKLDGFAPPPRREPSAEDARRVTLEVTPAGRAFARRAPEAAQAQLISALESLPRARLAALSRGLRALGHALETGAVDSDRARTAGGARRARAGADERRSTRASG